MLWSLYVYILYIYIYYLVELVSWMVLSLFFCLYVPFFLKANKFILSETWQGLFGIDLVFTDTHRHFSHLSLLSNGIFLVHCSVFSYQTMLRSSWHDSDRHLTKKYFDSMFSSARSYSGVFLDSFSGMFLYLLKTV